jgi:hypothetical protein
MRVLRKFSRSRISIGRGNGGMSNTRISDPLNPLIRVSCIESFGGSPRLLQFWVFPGTAFVRPVRDRRSRRLVARLREVRRKPAINEAQVSFNFDSSDRSARSSAPARRWFAHAKRAPARPERRFASPPAGCRRFSSSCARNAARTRRPRDLSRPAARRDVEAHALGVKTPWHRLRSLRQ